MEKYKIEPYNENEGSRNFKKEEAYLRAKKKVDAIVGFYWHLAVYIIVNLFLIILIGVNAGFNGFGTYATALFWGIGLMFHFLGVFGPTFLFGKNWENKKIEKYMEKDREHWE
ncbi:2TM domain-containing protein [Winogradskyella bathintestinalis]|uniref:2TM domain-containing protein n=1 Tax=Winogradskyella bathintestinalis TaxID=3035208 RepID=A0ABT7ZWP6_9FLAO|nr:2TM domain-containing protein [Winogradskyella bathintestinalis]MDN3493394.1 2TM domain-containing protein [Winogradskyella bathintestinalis]